MLGVLSDDMKRVLISVDRVEQHHVLALPQVAEGAYFLEGSLLLALLGQALVHHLKMIELVARDLIEIYSHLVGLYDKYLLRFRVHDFILNKNTS